MMKRIDIAIAGCGIAGLCAALLLHRQGHRVTLYERFDKARPLGSGLMIQPTGLAVLARLGLAEMVVAAGARVDALLGLNTEGEPVLEASYADLPIPRAFGLGIHRASLFDVLYAAVQAEGIVLHTGHVVTSSETEDRRRRLVFEDGNCSPWHDLVIDAAGLGSRLVPGPATLLPFGALWATLDWPACSSLDRRVLEQRYDRAARMVGLLPLGEGKAAFFWSMHQDDYRDWQDRGPLAWRSEVCALWPGLEPIADQLDASLPVVFARYCHRTTRDPVGAGIVHIGDAWHAASPQLGQGANMALLDAWALACAIGEAGEIDMALARFLRLRRGHVRLYQWLTWAFTPPFQSASVWPAIFRDQLMAPASRIGPLPKIKALTLSGLLGAPLARLGLEPPDYASLAAAAGASSPASAA